MSTIIKQEIESLQEEVRRLKDLRPEYLFSLVCYKYFFNQGRLDYADFRNTFVDGRSDGGIDLIALAENGAPTPTVVLMQSKSSKTIDDLSNVVADFLKMERTVRDFREGKVSKYNTRLKRVYKNRMSDAETHGSNIEMVLFLGVDLSEERRKSLDQLLAASPQLVDYNPVYYTLSEIETQIRTTKEPARSVKYAAIEIDNSGGTIKYGDDGLMVSVWGHSLADLYHRFKDEGLFEQNFRYFITNKRIDNNIKESLKKKRKDFWYLNNGIIIGCSEWEKDGNKVKLWNFSIINGCQTATLIGEYKGSNEDERFVLPCKIVRSEREEFISEIARASNSQKPISDRCFAENTTS